MEVQKDGRVIGHANAMLNLDRMLRGVLGFARRDQGEIPFAIDRQGALYTPEASDKSRLEALGVERTAAVAASGTPRRSGDWIIVSRRAPSGIIFGIARPVGASLREIRRASVRNLGLGLMVIALALVGIIPISHRMTQHLATLTRGVHQLSGGDFSTRVPVRSIGRIRGAGRRVQPDGRRPRAPRSAGRRAGTAAEGTRAVAAHPDRDAAAWFASLRSRRKSAACRFPAREVGGDFFNYFVLPDGRLALLVGDVSGKGVSAALLMANIQATLRARLPHETDLATLADRLDRELDQNTPGGVYLTLFMAILDIDGRLLRYVNAGHNPQFVLRVGRRISPLASTGMPIALYAGHGYSEASVELAAGDLLFFYTDGLVETENEQKDMFGAERLQAILERVRTDGIDTILQTVEAARESVSWLGRTVRRRDDDGAANQLSRLARPHRDGRASDSGRH